MAPIKLSFFFTNKNPKIKLTTKFCILKINHFIIDPIFFYRNYTPSKRTGVYVFTTKIAWYE